MNWGAFDLNLLIVFDAVMQERNVTRAGSRIGLSQPAMSHALNRLRYMLKDELFVRTPEGMVPTPRAEALAQPLRNAYRLFLFRYRGKGKVRLHRLGTARRQGRDPLNRDIQYPEEWFPILIGELELSFQIVR